MAELGPATLTIKAIINPALTELKRLETQGGAVLTVLSRSLKITVDGSQARTEIGRVVAGLTRVTNQKIKVEVDASGSLAALTPITTALRGLSNRSLKITVDTTGAAANLTTLETKLTSLRGIANPFTIRFSILGNIAELQALVAALTRVSTIPPPPPPNSSAVAALVAQLRTLQNQQATGLITATQYEAELNRIQAAATSMAGTLALSARDTAALSGVVRQANTALNGLGGGTRNVAGDLTNLRSQMGTARASFDSGRTSAAQYEAELRRLQGEFRTLASSGQASATQLTQINNQIANTARQINTLNGRVNLTGLSGNIQTALQGLGSANPQVAQLTSLFGGLTSAGGPAAAAVLLVATALGGLAFGLGKSIEVAGGFEQKLADIRALTSPTAVELSQLNAAARSPEVQKLGFGATQAAAAILELSRAGVSAKESVGGALKASLEFAGAAAIDTASAVKFAVTGVTAFGLDVEKDLGRVGDVFANFANKTVLGAEDLAVGIGAVGPVARSSGLSIEQLTGILITAAQGGFKRMDDAGTSLKTLLINLRANVHGAGDAANVMGIKIFDAAGKQRDMTLVLKDLAVKLRTMTDEQKAATSKIIGGSDAMRLLDILSTQATDALEKNTAAASKQGESARVAADRNKSYEGSQRQLKAAMENLAITVGEKLLPVMTKIVDAVSQFVRGLTDSLAPGGRLANFLERDLKPILIVIGGLFLAIKANAIAAFGANVASTLGALLVTLGGPGGLTLLLGGVSTALRSVLTANPFGILLTAATALGAYVTKLSSDIEGIYKGIDDANAKITGQIQSRIEQLRKGNKAEQITARILLLTDVTTSADQPEENRKTAEASIVRLKKERAEAQKEIDRLQAERAKSAAQPAPTVKPLTPAARALDALPQTYQESARAQNLLRTATDDTQKAVIRLKDALEQAKKAGNTGDITRLTSALNVLKKSSTEAKDAASGLGSALSSGRAGKLGTDLDQLDRKLRAAKVSFESGAISAGQYAQSLINISTLAGNLSRAEKDKTGDRFIALRQVVADAKSEYEGLNKATQEATKKAADEEKARVKQAQAVSALEQNIRQTNRQYALNIVQGKGTAETVDAMTRRYEDFEQQISALPEELQATARGLLANGRAAIPAAEGIAKTNTEVRNLKASIKDLSTQELENLDKKLRGRQVGKGGGAGTGFLSSGDSQKLSAVDVELERRQKADAKVLESQQKTGRGIQLEIEQTTLRFNALVKAGKVSETAIVSFGQNLDRLKARVLELRPELRAQYDDLFANGRASIAIAKGVAQTTLEVDKLKTSVKGLSTKQLEDLQAKIFSRRISFDPATGVSTLLAADLAKLKPVQAELKIRYKADVKQLEGQTKVADKIRLDLEQQMEKFGAITLSGKVSSADILNYGQSLERLKVKVAALRPELRGQFDDLFKQGAALKGRSQIVVDGNVQNAEYEKGLKSLTQFIKGATLAELEAKRAAELLNGADGQRLILLDQQIEAIKKKGDAEGAAAALKGDEEVAKSNAADVVAGYEREKQARAGNLSDLLKLEVAYGKDVRDARNRLLEAQAADDRAALQTRYDALIANTTEGSTERAALEGQLAERLGAIDTALGAARTQNETARVRAYVDAESNLRDARVKLGQDADAAILKNQIEALQEKTSALERGFQEELAGEELTSKEKLGILERQQGALLEAKRREIIELQTLERDAEIKRFFAQLESAKNAGILTDELQVKLAEQNGSNLQAIDERYGRQYETYSLALEKGVSAGRLAVKRDEKQRLDALNTALGEAAQNFVAQELEGIDSVSRAQRTAARTTLENWLITYRAQGDAGKKAVEQIEAGLRKLDELDSKLRSSATTRAAGLGKATQGLSTKASSIGKPESADGARQDVFNTYQGVLDEIEAQIVQAQADLLELQNRTDAGSVKARSQIRESLRALTALLNGTIATSNQAGQTAFATYLKDAQDRSAEAALELADTQKSLAEAAGTYGPIEKKAYETALLDAQKYWKGRSDTAVKGSGDYLKAAQKLSSVSSTIRQGVEADRARLETDLKTQQDDQKANAEGVLASLERQYGSLESLTGAALDSVTLVLEGAKKTFSDAGKAGEDALAVVLAALNKITLARNKLGKEFDSLPIFDQNAVSSSATRVSSVGKAETRTDVQDKTRQSFQPEIDRLKAEKESLSAAFFGLGNSATDEQIASFNASLLNLTAAFRNLYTTAQGEAKKAGDAFDQQTLDSAQEAKLSLAEIQKSLTESQGSNGDAAYQMALAGNATYWASRLKNAKQGTASEQAQYLVIAKSAIDAAAKLKTFDDAAQSVQDALTTQRQENEDGARLYEAESEQVQGFSDELNVLYDQFDAGTLSAADFAEKSADLSRRILEAASSSVNFKDDLDTLAGGADDATVSMTELARAATTNAEIAADTTAYDEQVSSLDTLNMRVQTLRRGLEDGTLSFDDFTTGAFDLGKALDLLASEPGIDPDLLERIKALQGLLSSTPDTVRAAATRLNTALQAEVKNELDALELKHRQKLISDGAYYAARLRLLLAQLDLEEKAELAAVTGSEEEKERKKLEIQKRYSTARAVTGLDSGDAAQKEAISKAQAELDLARASLQVGLINPAQYQAALRLSLEFWQATASSAQKGSKEYVEAVQNVLNIQRELAGESVKGLFLDVQVKFKTGFDGGFDSLKTAIDGIAGGFGALLNPLGLLASILEKINPVGEILAGVFQVLEAPLQALKEPLQAVGRLLGVVLAPVLQLFTPLVEAVVLILTPLLEVLQPIVSFFSSVMLPVFQALAPILTAIGNIFTGVYDAIVGFLTSLPLIGGLFDGLKRPGLNDPGDPSKKGSNGTTQKEENDLRQLKKSFDLGLIGEEEYQNQVYEIRRVALERQQKAELAAFKGTEAEKFELQRKFALDSSDLFTETIGSIGKDKKDAEKPAPAGSISDIQNQISAAQARFNNATTDSERKAIAKEIKDLNKTLEKLQNNGKSATESGQDGAGNKLSGGEIKIDGSFNREAVAALVGTLTNLDTTISDRLIPALIGQVAGVKGGQDNSALFAPFAASVQVFDSATRRFDTSVGRFDVIAGRFEGAMGQLERSRAWAERKL